MRCQWCKRSETGLCYLHWEAERRRHAAIGRALVRAVKAVLVAMVATAAYGWLR